MTNIENGKKIKTRLLMYFIGLFLMTAGIALSVKSNLGVSPVSSIPYTMTCVWGMEMGMATTIFHAFLVLLQILLLRKKFKVKNLLQVLAGIIFGMFTTFCNMCASYLPTPENLFIRIFMILISTVLIAAGIFLYVPADIIPLAGEGITQTVSDLSGIAFPKMKVVFDLTVVTVSLITCLLAIHSFGSVGIGTVLAAALVGVNLGYITKIFGERRDRLL